MNADVHFVQGFGEDGEQGGAGAATVGSSANADDDVDILTIPADAQLLSGSDSDAEAEGVGASGGRAGYGDGQERGSLHYLPVVRCICVFKGPRCPSHRLP